MALDKEKQKLLIVGVLGLVVLGVGAFQFMSSSSPPVSTTEKKPEPDKQAEPGQTGDALAGIVASTSLPRDPFVPGRLPEQPKPATDTVKPTNPPTQQESAGSRRIGSRSTPSLPPLRPMSGNIDLGRGLPNPLGGEKASQTTPPGRTDDFNYSVSGVVVGQRPVAVFEDGSGKQLLVPLGGSINGQSRVIGIERGKVILEHRGKRLTLTTSGTTKDAGPSGGGKSGQK